MNLDEFFGVPIQMQTESFEWKRSPQAVIAAASNAVAKVKVEISLENRPELRVVASCGCSPSCLLDNESKRGVQK
jgi:hypothetical protein